MPVIQPHTISCTKEGPRNQRILTTSTFSVSLDRSIYREACLGHPSSDTAHYIQHTEPISSKPFRGNAPLRPA